MEKQRILVIGAGVIGLTTTYTLAKKGYRVTVLSDQYACEPSTSYITSEVAAGIWQVPYFPQMSKDFQNKIKNWSLQSYKVFSQFASSSEETGVYLRNFHYVFRKKIDDMPEVKEFMNAHKHLPGFRHSCHLLHGYGSDVVDCFTYHGPTVDTDVFLQYIMKQCTLLGVKFCKGSVRGALNDQSEGLKKTYQVDLIVNCTGLAARELAGDPDVYPLIGAALILESRDGDIPKTVFDCTIEWQEENGLGGHVLVVPKGKDKLWIGTVKIEREYMKLTKDHPVIQRMLAEVKAIYPPIAKIAAKKQMTLRTASRPLRKGSPRVEQDPECPSVIHNYGQGGYGYIVSWGCAEDVVRIVEKAQPLTSKL